MSTTGQETKLNPNCIFCKIVEKTVPSDIIYEVGKRREKLKKKLLWLLPEVYSLYEKVEIL